MRETKRGGELDSQSVCERENEREGVNERDKERG